MALLLRASKVIQGSPEIVIDSGQIIIGRLPSNNLVIPGSDVEPIHSLIEVDGKTGEATLTDLGSDSGVKLNGRVIEVVETLKLGDKIQIGDVIIEVLDPSQVAPRRPAPPAIDRKTKVAEKGAVLASSNNNNASKKMGTSVEQPKEDEAPRESAKRPAAANFGAIFEPGKERPSGATLEVVAYWDQSILDVRHYGGSAAKNESPRPDNVIIGNEEDGHLVGVGPRADTRNYLLASVDGSKTNVILNSDMRARVRRGGRFEKIQGPGKFALSSKEIALIKHGPVTYFMMNVAMPNPLLPVFPDIDGKPVIFVYGALVYLLMAVGIFSVSKNYTPEEFDKNPWDTVQLTSSTPTPVPTKAIPEPKKPVEVKLPPPKVEPPKPKPVQTVAKVVETAKPVAPKVAPVKVPDNSKDKALKGEVKNKDSALGPKNNAAKTGNSGGEKGGTTGAFAGKREGNKKTDHTGVEDAKKDVMSGMNLDKLGAGLGKTLDLDAAGQIATGLKSSAGGEGAASGSGKRGSHGFGGIGNGNTLAVGGPGRGLGIGGGAGGLGAGGLGGEGNGQGAGGAGNRIKATGIVVPSSPEEVGGGLTSDEIEAVIKANLAQIKACYERFLQGNRSLGGRVKAAFVVGTSGQVTQSGIKESTVNSPGMESCISGAIKRWKFPIPRGTGEVKVTYPFVFNSAN